MLQSEIESPAKPATEILHELKVHATTVAPGSLAPDLFEHLATRREAFGWIHGANLSVTIEDLARVFRDGKVLAPRTGHLGNWTEIAAGRSGALDGNAAICEDSRLGYPLIYDLNQTEDETLALGDNVYLPGSMLKAGRREKLPVFRWTTTGYERASRDAPYFVPFLLTEFDGQRLPLSQLHREVSAAISSYDFRYHSDFLLSQQAKLRELLEGLVEGALSAPDPDRELRLIFDRSVRRDAVVERKSIERTRSGFRLGEATFGGIREFVEAALVPLLAAADPKRFFLETAAMPSAVPLVSAELNSVLYAVLYTHYPKHRIDSRTVVPCNVHLHWGAVQMAGYPPRKRGHFPNSASETRKICRHLLARFSEVPPIYFVLLPASIFMLCPSSARVQDHPVLETLYEQALEQNRRLGEDRSAVTARIEMLVDDWWSRYRGSLSPYFVQGFRNIRSVLASEDTPDFGRPVQLPSFLQLPIWQACVLVGALYRVMTAAI